LVKVVHYRKNHIRDFAKQIFKWAKAKVAIIKKHGMEGLLSHVYLWPMYVTILFVIGFGVSFVLNLIFLFIYLFLLCFISYFGLMLAEAGRLYLEHNTRKLFWYSLLLIPVVHGEYFFGTWSALIRKKIW
jgi:hypothetical protein